MKTLLWSLLLILAGTLIGPVAVGGDEKSKAPDVDPTLVAFFDSVQRATVDEDPGAMVKLWDMREAAAAIKKAGFLASLRPERAARIEDLIGRALTRAVRRRRLIAPFETHKIRRVSEGDRPNTRVVYLWLYDPDGVLFKIYGYVVKRGDSWALYDLGDPDLERHVLHVFGVLLVEALGGTPPAWEGAGLKMSQAERHMHAGEYEEAQGLLVELEAMALPNVLALPIELMLALVSHGQGDLAAATAYLDEYADMGGTAPVQHALRATMYNEQSLWRQAVSEARRYIELLDADPDIVLELVVALRSLGRPEEAVEALTPALVESPANAFLLAQYACCVADPMSADIEARFAGLEDAVAAIRLAATACMAQGLQDRLRLLARILKKEDPTHHDVLFYEAYALYLEHNYRAAADLFEKVQAAVFSLPEDEQPWDHGALWSQYVDALLEALLEADDPCGAYDRSHDPVYALEYVADYLLLDADDGDALRAFLAHAASHPPKRHAEMTRLLTRYYEAEADHVDGKDKVAVKNLSALRPLVQKAMAADDEQDALWSLCWQLEDRLVRLLIGQKRYAEARVVIDEIGARDGPASVFLVLLHAALGDVAKVGGIIREAVNGGEDPAEFFDEPDLRKALQAPAYAALRRELLGEKQR